MIRYALACDQAHEFEGWFGSSEDFDAQAAAAQIGCPACGSTAVAKQIMAPMVAGTKRNSPDMTPQARDVMMQAMSKVRQHVEDNFVRREFNYNTFERSFQLPKTIDQEKIDAKYEMGKFMLSGQALLQLLHEGAGIKTGDFGAGGGKFAFAGGDLAGQCGDQRGLTLTLGLQIAGAFLLQPQRIGKARQLICQ